MNIVLKVFLMMDAGRGKIRLSPFSPFLQVRILHLVVTCKIAMLLKIPQIISLHWLDKHRVGKVWHTFFRAEAIYEVKVGNFFTLLLVTAVITIFPYYYLFTRTHEIIMLSTLDDCRFQETAQHNCMHDSLYNWAIWPCNTVK